MANRIKGITLEIDGSTTGLDKALKGVNSSIRETSKSLKDVNRLLKIDPKNTELLAQKQKLLSEAVGKTKDKLSQLQVVQKQAKEQLENGDLGQDKYDALQREIIETENELKKLEKQQRETETTLKGSIKSISESLTAAGGKIKGVGDKIQSFSKTMTTHVTAPIVAGATASVAAFKEVDGAMDTLVQKTGANGKALEDMEGIVKSIATTIPTSFDTAANAVGEVNTKLGLTDEELESLSTKFIQFSELNNTDVSQAIDNTAQVMAAWGLNAKGTSEYLDVLNRTSQNTAIPVDNLSSKLIDNQVALQKMGLEATDAVYMLGKLEMSGLNTDKVIGGLSKAYKYCATNGLSFDDTLAALQNEVVSSNGSMESLSKCLKIFGKSGDQVFKALRIGKLDFADMLISQDALKDSMDSVSKTYQATVDPIDEAKMAMNDAKLIGAEIVTTAAPMLRDALSAVRDVIKDLRTWWDGLSEDEQKNILKMAGIAAAVGPVIAVLGSLVSTIGTIITVIGSLGAAAPVIGTVAAFIVAIIATINNFRLALKALSVMWDALSAGMKEKWGELKQSTKDAVDDMASRWNAWKNDTGKKISETVSAAKQKFDSMKENAKTTFENMKTSISQKLDQAKNFASQKFEQIKGLARFVWNLPKLGIDAVTGIVDKVRGAINKVKGFMDFKWSLPKIKLPHFSISGSFSLNPPSTPHFSVDWYAKAMEKGMILNNATIFGRKGDKLLAGGEAGSETVVGTRSLMSMIHDAVARAMQAVRNIGSGVYAAATQPSAVSVTYGDVNMTINGAKGQDVRELADIVSDRLRSAYDREDKVWA